MLDQAVFEAWTPNPNIASMLDIDLRYVRAEFHGLDLGGFRVGTDVRCRF